MSYSPPPLHQFAHFSTIVPNRFRPVPHLGFKRETVNTADDDFIDLDISAVGGKSAALLLHGLEGSSESNYIIGMTQMLNSIGMDAIALNFRSCSGRINRQVQSYHSGKSDDVRYILNHIQSRYDSIHLIGFSLGGNVALKYTGESNKLQIKSVTAISVPCDLAGSSKKLEELQNRVYLSRFLKQLKEKAIQKSIEHPEFPFEIEAIQSSRTFYDFDNAFTAPVHGFLSADDYYSKSSSKQFVAGISIPTLIINAQNDSFLSPTCFPIEESDQNRNVNLLIPRFGGHVGFASNFRMTKPFWHEKQVAAFIRELG
jgi:hypothetical protein